MDTEDINNSDREKNIADIKNNVDDEHLDIQKCTSVSSNKRRYAVVFFVRYKRDCRPDEDSITEYFSKYGDVGRVNCPLNKNIAFVFMSDLNTTDEKKKTRATIKNIISDITPDNKFHISVANSNYKRNNRRNNRTYNNNNRRESDTNYRYENRNMGNINNFDNNRFNNEDNYNKNHYSHRLHYNNFDRINRYGNRNKNYNNYPDQNVDYVPNYQYIKYNNNDVKNFGFNNRNNNKYPNNMPTHRSKPVNIYSQKNLENRINKIRQEADNYRNINNSHRRNKIFKDLDRNDQDKWINNRKK